MSANAFSSISFLFAREREREREIERERQRMWGVGWHAMSVLAGSNSARVFGIIFPIDLAKNKGRLTFAIFSKPPYL